MARKVTEKIKIWGVIQGVGFRPYVAKIAARMDMRGTVANIGGLVEIYVTDSEKRVDEFLRTIRRELPQPAEIVHIKIEEVQTVEFDNFSILKSDQGEKDLSFFPADIALCPDCLAEMRDPDNRRFEHPFISCMVCGPRYTIVDRFPYDRDNTSMIDWPMCPQCEEEYTNLADRRYHAQTVSCHDCGPKMLARVRPEDETDKEPLDAAAALLREGRVIAFKGMGGYYLMCNTHDPEAIRNLREIKGREAKPFAVMYRDMEQIKRYCYVGPVEESLLTSSARPILLLERRTLEELEAGHPNNYDEFLKSRFVGAFLPSMGAQYMLMNRFGGSVIATSANISDMPIIKDDEEMFALMDKTPALAGIFYNERKIRTSADDSVVRVVDGQPQMIRRSKGYVPTPLYVESAKEEIFATGGHLKNSFALSKAGFVYPSRYFGDLDGAANQREYGNNVQMMEKLFRITPQKVVCDMHPNYFTTRFAKEYATTHGLPLLQVQHHHAHVASVMAEHKLEGPLIGVAFDGTGYGMDGKIWGGEFLICEKGEFKRARHMKYVKMIGGDASMRDGWKSALSWYYDWETSTGERTDCQEDEFEIDIEDIIEYADLNDTLEHRKLELTEKVLDAGINVIESSSMGRLFDGVAALLGGVSVNSYEGQCAIWLEDAAARALQEPGMNEADDLALAFHHRVARMIVAQCWEIAEEIGSKQVVLTGGVFQNHILMKETLHLLRAKGFEVYYNVSVSPNDGGIALGQAYVASYK